MHYLIYQELQPATFDVSDRWPALSVPDENLNPVPMHIGQLAGMSAKERIVALIAGSQSGKTGFGPQWLWQQIQKLGGGDWFAVTSTYDLFKLKMLPALVHFFVNQLGIARYWSGDRMLELKDPGTGLFHATRVSDPMWGRIILRSADSTGGLEAGTGKGAWLDEAGQDNFGIDSWKAILRRLAISQGPILLTTTLYEYGFLDTEIIARVQAGGATEVTQTDRGTLEVTTNPDPKVNIRLVQYDSTINPVYPMEEYEYARSTMAADEFEAFMRGRRVTSRLQIYDCFDFGENGNVVKPFTIPEDWVRYMGIDPGGANLAAVKLAERPTDKRLFQYAEYLSGGKTMKGHWDAFAGDEVFELVFCGAKSEGQWRSELRAIGVSASGPATSDVKLGISRVYAEYKTHGLQIFDTCKGTLDQVRRYRHKQDKTGAVLDTIEAKQTFHYLDAQRYPVASIRPTERMKTKVKRLG